MRVAKNKKADFTGDFPVIAIAAVVIIVIWTSLYFTSTDSNKLIETAAPELSYEFPRQVLETFLTLPLNSSNKVLLGFNENETIIINDIISRTDEGSIKVIDSMNLKYTNYLREHQDVLNSFSDFSGNEKVAEYSAVEQYTLVSISREITTLPELEEYVKRKNYYIPFPSDDGKFVVIEFLPEADLLYGGIFR